MKVLLDLNVLLDFLNQREYHAEAARILDFAADNKFTACASAHEMTTLAYFLEKQEKKPGECRQTLSMLFNLFQILPVDKEILEKALHSGIDDFEDAVLEAAAIKSGTEFIVTRNVKDFVRSKVQAVNPVQFLELIQRKA